MPYSDEQKRNSKINRAELDAYIIANFIEIIPDKLTHMSAPCVAEAVKEPSNNMFMGAAASSIPAAAFAEAPVEKSSRKSIGFGTVFTGKKSGSSEKNSKPVRKQGGLKKSTEEAGSAHDLLPGSGYFEESSCEIFDSDECSSYDSDDEELYKNLNERVKHVEDSFSDYLMYLIESKGMNNAEVYKRALVDKKVFSKIKNNPDYHPQKLTAMCLCIGAMLNLDESRDLLARAGYALSPSDKTDIIFKYFIEKGIYDMIELDIQLEEHGLDCIIA